MKLTSLTVAVVILIVLVSNAYAVTMTFDDIPEGDGLGYYDHAYGISWDSGFYVADHTGSTWGPANSGSKVLAWNYPGPGYESRGMMFKKILGMESYEILNACSVGGYFNTESGVVLQLVGYHDTWDDPVASAYIGASGESWQNVYVQIDSPAGQITMVEFRPVTDDALAHFCADDINVNFVPEPASLLVLCAGLVPLAFRRRRRR